MDDRSMLYRQNQSAECSESVKICKSATQPAASTKSELGNFRSLILHHFGGVRSQCTDDFEHHKSLLLRVTGAAAGTPDKRIEEPNRTTIQDDYIKQRKTYATLATAWPESSEGSGHR